MYNGVNVQTGEGDWSVSQETTTAHEHQQPNTYNYYYLSHTKQFDEKLLNNCFIATLLWDNSSTPIELSHLRQSMELP